MSVPLDVRKQLWAWRYGMRAFEHCKAASDHILNAKLKDDHPLYYPLNLAAHVSYARPFTKSYGLEPLSIEIVPKEFRHVHKKIIERRNKMYAHTDAVGTQSGVDIDVLFVVDHGKKRGLNVLEVTIQPMGFDAISKLCAVLSDKCYYHMNKLIHKYVRELPIIEGTYRIGVKPTDPEFSMLK